MRECRRAEQGGIFHNCSQAYLTPPTSLSMSMPCPPKFPFDHFPFLLICFCIHSPPHPPLTPHIPLTPCTFPPSGPRHSTPHAASGSTPEDHE